MAWLGLRILWVIVSILIPSSLGWTTIIQSRSPISKIISSSSPTRSIVRHSCSLYPPQTRSVSSSSSSLYTSSADTSDDTQQEELEALLAKWEPEKVSSVGNLCADDEWMGLSMELTELVRVAVLEEVKKNARDFIGKDNYKVCSIIIP